MTVSDLDLNFPFLLVAVAVAILAPRKDYLEGLGELRKEFDEMKRFPVLLKKNNQSELVHRFCDMTYNKVESEYYSQQQQEEGKLE